MQKYNIHEAKTRLSYLIDNAVKGNAIDSYHTLMTEKLPKVHKDPFDRILVTQAQTEKATIITSDKIFSEYPCSAIYVKPPRQRYAI